MKKKALSFDEKRERLLNIFHERKEVFNLKELEKLGGKAGIVPQTVKEVLESLISDNLVESDKIGSGNFYWSLPSKAYQNLSTKLKEYEDEIEKLIQTKENLELEITEQMLGREETNERKENLQKLKSLKEEYEKKLAAVEKYRRNDPERLKQLHNEAKAAKDKANQWTDNIFITKQWLMSRNPALSEDDLNTHFGIPADLDNL